MTIDWDFSVVWQNRGALLSGLWVSVHLSVLSGAIGTAIALPAALATVSRVPAVRVVTISVLEVLRAIPLPLKLLWVFYGIPYAGGPTLSPYATALLVFTVNFVAFAADVFRGAIRTIPQAQIDGAVVLGMSRSQVARRVLLPEIARRSLPAWNGLFITLLKLSSIASIIAVPELLHTASLVLSDRPKPFEVYTALVVMYAAVVIPVSLCLRSLERSRWFTVEINRP
jgi:polar amino acid transport system permease protein